MDVITIHKTTIIRRTNPIQKCFSSRLADVFIQSIEARCLDENEDVVGEAPTLNYIGVIDNFIAY